MARRGQGELHADNSIVGCYWNAKLLDLRVELSFTVSNKPESVLAFERADRAIEYWTNLHQPIQLLHAHLRHAVLHRYRFIQSQSKFRQIDPYLHDSILSLYQAQEESLPVLGKLQTVEAQNARFALYNDLAKTMCRAREFDRAKMYLGEAQAICNELKEPVPQQWLNLLITRSTFIRACLIEKRIAGHVRDLEDLAEEIEDGLNRPLDYEDVVLREILAKSRIPLLVGIGKREEADELLSQCKQGARQYQLNNHRRDLSYLARVLEIKGR